MGKLSNQAFDIFAITTDFVKHVETVINARAANHGALVGGDAKVAEAVVALALVNFDANSVGDINGFTIKDLEELAQYLESLKKMYEDPHLHTTGAELLLFFNRHHAQDKLTLDIIVNWLKTGAQDGTVFFPDATQVAVDMFDDFKGADTVRPNGREAMKRYLGASATTDQALDQKMEHVDFGQTSVELFNSVEALAGSFDGTGGVAPTPGGGPVGPGDGGGPVGPGPGDGGNPGDGRGDGV